MDGRRYLAFVPQHGRGGEGPVQRAAALVRPQVQARTVQRARHAHVPVPLRREGRDLEGKGATLNVQRSKRTSKSYA